MRNLLLGLVSFFALSAQAYHLDAVQLFSLERNEFKSSFQTAEGNPFVGWIRTQAVVATSLGINLEHKEVILPSDSGLDAQTAFYESIKKEYCKQPEKLKPVESPTAINVSAINIVDQIGARLNVTNDSEGKTSYTVDDNSTALALDNLNYDAGIAISVAANAAPTVTHLMVWFDDATTATYNPEYVVLTCDLE